MSRKIISIILALCLLCGCAKTEAEVPAEESTPQVQEVVKEEAKPREVVMDWEKYRVNFALYDGMLEQHGHLIYRQRVGWLEVKWIIDLAEETAWSIEELEALYGRKGQSSQTGAYSGLRFGQKNGIEQHFYLSDGNYQVHLVGYAQYSDYTADDFEKEIASMKIEKGDFAQDFGVSKEELTAEFAEMMKNLDIIMDYIVRKDFTAMDLDGLKTEVIPLSYMKMADPGPWLDVTSDVLFAEVTAKNFGEDFPWTNTAELRESMMEVYCTLNDTGLLGSELLVDRMIAFRDVHGTLFFNTTYLSMIKDQDMTELWDMDSIELLEEVDGTIAFRIDRKNSTRKITLLTVKQNDEGEWRLSGNNFTLFD